MKHSSQTLIVVCSLLACLVGCSDDIIEGNRPVIEPVYPKIDEFPAWCPDGSRIIYFHNALVDTLGSYLHIPDSTGLWICNADGTDARLLLRNFLTVQARWFLDAGSIAFSAQQQIFKARIVGGCVDTASIVQITRGGSFICPSPSPDGSWIVCNSTVFDPHGALIWKIREDGSTQEAISDGVTPDWSPAGDRIVISKNPDHELAELFTIDVDGENPSRLTFNQSSGWYPEYSPDGSKIAYVVNNELWIINSNGGTPTRIIGNVLPYGLSWCPQGDRIAFPRKTLKEDPNENGTIWIVSLDGSSLTQVTRGIK